MKEQAILQAIHDKLGIHELNYMQAHVLKSVDAHSNAIIYSPTGTGKTIAYALLILKAMKNLAQEQLQIVVIAPSRELVTQISEVLRMLSTGKKVTALYGGHNVADEKNSLLAMPSIIVATPGRPVSYTHLTLPTKA